MTTNRHDTNRQLLPLSTAAVLLAVSAPLLAMDDGDGFESIVRPALAHGEHDDYTDDEEIVRSPEWAAGLRDRIAGGEFQDRSRRLVPPAAPILRGNGNPHCVTPSQFVFFEDTDGLLLTNFSPSQLLNLMFDAGEAMIAEHGDNFDFVGYFINFTPHHRIGQAFYNHIFNDVDGIGLPQFDNRSVTITNSERAQGVVMMWDINNPRWAPGNGTEANFTRLVLGQEFEHRWGAYLPALLDGRRMQGDDVCGRRFHWNLRLDTQASCMESLEWVGEDPAIVQLNDTMPLGFNGDIPGGVWSYLDLYLMGYATPEEMDANMSEMRFMDEWLCNGPDPYFGPISHIDSSDIIAAAGQRIPDAASSQHDYRTGWIVIHLPGDEPDAAELNKAAGILNQFTDDYTHSTLGRGSMDNTLFDDCNCNGVADTDDIANGTSNDANGNGIPDECEPGTPAEIVDAQVTTGTLLGGGVSELIASDNSYFHTRSGFGPSLIDLHKVDVRVLATTSATAPVTIDVAVEGHIDQPAGQAQLRLRNVTTGELDVIGQFNIGLNDASELFAGLDAGLYVNGDGDIEAQVTNVVFVPFFAFNFDSFLDQVSITVHE